MVAVRLTVYAPAQMQTTVTVGGDWGATAYSALRSLRAGENVLAVELTARDVALWWPVGYGCQPLYNLSATAGSSTMRRKLGFRGARLQTDRGVARKGERSGSGNTSMALLVNGQRVLALGSSLVPLDTFAGRTSAAATRRMLLSVVHGGMNSLRIWGGGTFLTPLFYEICDELGIMLLHDFMLSWYPNVPYPAFPAYRARIAREVQQKVTDLARHPAIVLWFGGNEDQCTKYDPARPDACHGKNWYPDCQQVCVQNRAFCRVGGQGKAWPCGLRRPHAHPRGCLRSCARRSSRNQGARAGVVGLRPKAPSRE